MAGSPAPGVVLSGRERVRRGIIGELGVCPSVGVRESLAILHDEINVFLGVRDANGKGGLRTLFRFPLDLRNFGAVAEKACRYRERRPGRLRSSREWRFHLERFFGLTDGENLPGLVFSELREREPIRHLRTVLVLPGNGPAAGYPVAERPIQPS
jgi:hypothetical protein